MWDKGCRNMSSCVVCSFYEKLQPRWPCRRRHRHSHAFLKSPRRRKPQHGLPRECQGTKKVLQEWKIEIWYILFSTRWVSLLFVFACFFAMLFGHLVQPYIHCMNHGFGKQCSRQRRRGPFAYMKGRSEGSGMNTNFRGLTIVVGTSHLDLTIGKNSSRLCICQHILWHVDNWASVFFSPSSHHVFQSTSRSPHCIWGWHRCKKRWWRRHIGMNDGRFAV